jgi:hypothetical protein
MWLFGDSFDHYTDLSQKYESVGPYVVVGVGRGRFGTNSLSAPVGSVLRALTPGSSAAGAFLSMAMRIGTPGSSIGYFGFAELWNGTTDSGHVVLRYDVSNGTITVMRLYGGSLPLQTNYHSEVLGVTPVGLILPNVWMSVEAYVKVHATAGVVRVRINGQEVLMLTGINTLNEYGASAAWTGWHIGQEIGSGDLDMDDVMIYDDTDNGDGVADFLGDLTAECLVAAGPGASSQWTRNSGATNASCVDEIPPDGDATYVEDQTVGHVDTYTVSPLGRVSDGIVCVQVVTTAKKSGTGTRAVAGVVRRAATNFLGPAAYLATDYTVAVAAFPMDPSTSGAWTAGDVASTEIGQQVTV